ncbi:hypothetical protein K2Z83_24530 [Oscillochloris sp. ZM17-4]|uniref:hypothetical protein n=1 Tax=Oscillochloris sp. ZM17-4 TaxID=2866714 RepID=UPI001C735D02|nr:hypothetical protein [Oscillochloris sp. ZM17-4]MBX0330829.1 hypothetical protein [Oscillochloris sp. ZM17-4]
MIPTLVGMTVARAIPTATLAGLAMGRYALHGGVVRWAAGTPAAGQIVAHLLPSAGMASPLLAGAGIITSATSTVAATAATTAATAATIGAVFSGIAAVGAVVGAGFSIANFFQSKKILKAVHATMQVAELNLAVTRAGFSELDQRLIRLEQMLREVQQTLTSIHSLLESTQRAELLVALEHLEKLPTISDDRVRIELLTHSATTLGKLRRVYYGQMAQANNIPSGLGAEEYYLIAALGQVRCYAELRELAMARSILTDVVKEWQSWARPFTRAKLLGEHPQRFLYGDLAASAPLTMVGAWLDFATDAQEGLSAIEELRTKIEPWYYHRSLSDDLRDVRRADHTSSRDAKIVYDRDRVIPALNKMVARNAVLASYEGQYELMEQLRITPGELDAQIAALTPAAPGEEQNEDESMLVLLAA